MRKVKEKETANSNTHQNKIFIEISWMKIYTSDHSDKLYIKNTTYLKQQCDLCKSAVCVRVRARVSGFLYLWMAYFVDSIAPFHLEDYWSGFAAFAFLFCNRSFLLPSGRILLMLLFCCCFRCVYLDRKPRAIRGEKYESIAWVRKKKL